MSSLERKTSIVFDSKLQRQRKEEEEQRFLREKQQTEYAAKNNLDDLFRLMVTEVTTGGAPETEAEAQRRLFKFLAQRKLRREECKKRVQFRNTIELDFDRKIFFKVEVLSSVAGDVQLTLRNIMNPRFTMEDSIALSWQEYNDWEKVLFKLSQLTEPTTAVVQSVYGSVRADGMLSAVVPCSPAAKKVVDELWNLTMELRQTSKHVGLFQPL